MSKLAHSTDDGMAEVDRQAAERAGEKPNCETNGHIFGSRGVCVFCSTPKPMTPPDRPAQPAPDLDALLAELVQTQPHPFLGRIAVNPQGRRAADAITTLRARLAEAQAVSLKYQHAYGDRDNEAHRLSNRVAALEAALKDADGWLPIALCPTDGVWRLVKLSDGNEAVAAFDGVGLLSKKRWQTKVFLTHRPACPSPINDLVTQPARDVFLIADLENGVYPTHFRPNDTVFGLPALNGAAT